MKKILLAGLAVAALGLTSCTNNSNPVVAVGCTIEAAVVNTVAVSIASELQCTNQAAIVASMQAAATKAGICPSPAAQAIGKPKSKIPLKSVGSTICQDVADTAVAGLVGGIIPAAWGCSGTTATASLTTLINSACAKAFPG